METLSNLFVNPSNGEQSSKPQKAQIVFLMGDLNFRVGLASLECLKILDGISSNKMHGEALQQEIDKLLKHDQLTLGLKEIRSLRNLKEKKIAFLPTYKLEERTDSYDREKERAPSWYWLIILGAIGSSVMLMKGFMWTLKSTTASPEFSTPTIGMS